MRRLAAAVLAAALAAPAAAIGENDDDDAFPSLNWPGGFVLFLDATAPMSFVAMTPRDVPAGARPLGELSTYTCQRGVAIPLAAQVNASSVSGGYGDGGYKRALELLKQEHPELVGVYDVKVDLGIFSLLGGLYRSLCTYVSARGFAASPASP